MSGNCHYPGAKHMPSAYFWESCGRGRTWEICPACRALIRNARQARNPSDTGCIMCWKPMLPGTRADAVTCSQLCRQKLARIMREEKHR